VVVTIEERLAKLEARVLGLQAIDVPATLVMLVLRWAPLAVHRTGRLAPYRCELHLPSLIALMVTPWRSSAACTKRPSPR
jgi:hypothetical protein